MVICTHSYDPITFVLNEVDGAECENPEVEWVLCPPLIQNKQLRQAVGRPDLVTAFQVRFMFLQFFFIPYSSQSNR